MVKAFFDRGPRTLDIVAMKKSPLQSLIRIDENRKAVRIKQKGVIMLSDETSEYYCYAQLGNVSGDGMYFESENAFRPGSKIDIQYDNPPFKSSPKNYRAVVQWCRPLSEDESISSFGIGVKYS